MKKLLFEIIDLVRYAIYFFFKVNGWSNPDRKFYKTEEYFK